MSYGSQQPSPSPHPSLPARPPPSSATSGAPGTGSSGSSFAFKPRTVGGGPIHYTSTVSSGPAPPSNYSAAVNYGSEPSYQSNGNSYSQQGYFSQQPQQYSNPSPPQIRNPFPLPGQGGQDRNKDRWGNGDYDPEAEAQYQAWQSAYISRDETSTNKGFGSGSTGNPNLTALGTRGGNNAVIESAPALKAEAAAGEAVNGKPKKTVVRTGGGKTWEDPSLLEWDDAPFRIFAGNLAGEVTDESLRKGFAAYPSVQRTKVIRDKRTTKSKGYGFVSFSDGDDYFQAFKEMQGKYIGSHPIILKKSTTPITAVNAPNKDKHKKGRDGKGAGGRADTGAGVQKKAGKNKDGLKMLG